MNIKHEYKFEDFELWGVIMCEIGFLDFLNYLHYKIIQLQRFGSWIPLCLLENRETEADNRFLWHLVELASDLDLDPLTEAESRLRKVAISYSFWKLTFASNYCRSTSIEGMRA
jgi:hypothetical protein